jgi:hypothetical protein
MASRQVPFLSPIPKKYTHTHTTLTFPQHTKLHNPKRNCTVQSQYRNQLTKLQLFPFDLKISKSQNAGLGEEAHLMPVTSYSVFHLELNF